MTQMTDLETEEGIIEFVRSAAKNFAETENTSYGELTPGSLLALRWGLGKDCVLVVKLDEYFINRNFQQAVKQSGQ